MKRLITITMLLLLTSSVSHGNTTRFTGYAYDLDSGRLMYTERHQREIRPDGTQRLVTAYSDAAEREFARRDIVGDTDRRVIEFDMRDVRIGYREQARRNDRSIELTRTEPEDGTERETLSNAAVRDVVIDAGFSDYVSRNWDTLLSGETMRFEFANIDRLSLIKLQLKHVGSRQENGYRIEQFEMNAANFFIRLLLTPIRIQYYADNRELFRYEGISNVKDENGDNYEVRIEFPANEYVLEPATTRETAQR